MKRILNIASVILAAVIAASCEPAPQTGGDEDLNATFSFTLKVSEVGSDYAKINVRHDGPESVSWYGFVTEDTQKSDVKLITEKYTEFLAKGEVKGLRTTNNRTVEISGLETDKEYKYVVFAITADAKLYNNANSKSVVFMTGSNPYELVQTDEWTITRSNERLDNQEVVSISSTSSSLFVWDYVTKEYVDNFNANYPNGFDVVIDDQLLATLDAFQTYIINQIATIQYWVVEMGESINNYTYAYDSANPDNNVYTMPRLATGEYYFVAFGMNSDGSHTLTYSVSDLVTIEEEASTPEYEAWFGSYSFSGKGFWIFEDNAEKGMKYGDEKDVTYDITIEKLDNNFLYLIKGWECGESADMDIETEVFGMNKEDGDYLAFIGYYDAGKLEIREISMTTFAQSSTYYSFGLCGYAYNEQAESYAPVILEETPMAVAEPIAAGQTSTTLNGLETSFVTDSGVLNLTYDMMGYVLYNYETLQPAAIYNMPVKFPITITALSGEAAAASTMAERKSVLGRMKTGSITIEADKTARPTTYSRR